MNLRQVLDCGTTAPLSFPPAVYILTTGVSAECSSAYSFLIRAIRVIRG
jgi:hypothetical protein